ncbi:MAG: DUF2179 domain-containing protein [Planctomycetes bacterium]|nr:DUF2179 domain-containing protein [Planctomycetota bacterium]
MNSSMPELGLFWLPCLVFLAEMCVVTLGTIRIIFVSRGMKVLAPILGFFEITIWLFAISQIMQNLNNISCFLAFAGGFVAGNFLGILIEEKLAMGTALVRLITSKNIHDLVGTLSSAGYGVTCMDGQGANGPVQVVFTVVRRKEIDKITAFINKFDPKAFYSIDEVQAVNEGVFPLLRERAAVFRRDEALAA